MLPEFEKAAGYLEDEIRVHVRNLVRLRRSLWLVVWGMAGVGLIMQGFHYLSVVPLLQRAEQHLPRGVEALEGSRITIESASFGYGHLVLLGLLVVLLINAWQIRGEHLILRDLRRKKSRVLQMSILANPNLSERYEARFIAEALDRGSAEPSRSQDRRRRNHLRM